MTAAVWILSLALNAQAAGLRKPEIEELFQLVLAHSGFDADRGDRPAHPPTTLIPVPPAKERGVLAEAAPGHIYVEDAGLLKAFKTRGELAFILGHELAHLVDRDQEVFDGATKAYSDYWFAFEGSRMAADGESQDAIREAFGKDFRATADAISRKIELDADARSQQWLGEMVDPETRRPFGLEAAPKALRAILAARQAAGLEDREGVYPTLAVRIAAAESRARLPPSADH